MNKYIIWGLGLAVGLGAAYLVRLNMQTNAGGGGEVGSTSKTIDSGDCRLLCEAAVSACPSIVNVDLCVSRCPELDDTKRQALASADSCEQLTKNPELVAELAIPDKIAQPEPEPAQNECQAACANYVSKCLTLVPGANQSLYDEATASCLAECAGWEPQKTVCLKKAADCPAMTEQCGL